MKKWSVASISTFLVGSFFAVSCGRITARPVPQNSSSAPHQTPPSTSGTPSSPPPPPASGSNPISVPSPTGNPAPQGSPSSNLLQPTDFNYLGVTKISGAMGQFTSGLAYRPSTNTWFTIGFAGAAPYHLFEFSLPTPSLTMSTAPEGKIVRDWGAIDPTNTLLPPGAGSMQMGGLYYDPKNSKMWFSYGNWYGVSPTNFPSLGYLTVNDANGTFVVHGPWLTQVHSNRVEGGILFPLPSYLQSTLGMQWGVSAPRESGGGFSWGTGLVAFADPSNLPIATQDPSTWPAATTKATDLIFWQQINTTYPLGSANVFDYSNFPVPSAIGLNRNWLFGGSGIVGTAGQRAPGQFQTVTANQVTLQSGTPTSGLDAIVPGYYLILGVTQMPSGYPPTGEMHEVLAVDTTNSNAIVCTLDAPFSTPNVGVGTFYTPYDPNSIPTTIVPSSLHWLQGDVSYSGIWIELPNKHGFIQSLDMFLDYGWYANSDSLCDPTPNGAKFNADLDSRIFPGKKVIDYGHLGGHGQHAEAWSSQVAITDPAAIEVVAKRVASGQVTQSDFEVAPASMSAVNTLGGVFQTNYTGRGARGIPFTGGYFDVSSGNLYMLSPSSAATVNGIESAVEVWHILP